MAEQIKNLVSVIMPCYKMGRFIGEALESVGKQTYTNWEVIAVDDCGPEDGTKEAVEAFAKQFPNHRVIYHRHEKNGGVSAARNTAIGMAHGEYLAFLDPDDYYFPSKLEEAVSVLHANREVFLVHSSAFQKNTQSQSPKEDQIGFKLFDKSLSYRLSESENYLQRNWICNSTVVVRRLAFQVIRFPEKMLFQYEDWVVWMLISRAGLFHYNNTPQTCYRLHSESATAGILSNERNEFFATMEAILCLRHTLESPKEKFIAHKNLLGELIKIEKSCVQNSPLLVKKSHAKNSIINDLLFSILRIKLYNFLKRIRLPNVVLPCMFSMLFLARI